MNVLANEKDNNNKKQRTNEIVKNKNENDKNGKNFKLNLAPLDKCFLFF
jgi:hypothetical protein